MVFLLFSIFASSILTFFVNILNSGIVIKPMVSIVLFLISGAFVFKAVLEAKLVMSGILR